MRFQKLFLAMLLVLTTLFVGLGALSKNSAYGGHQPFGWSVLGHQAKNVGAAGAAELFQFSSDHFPGTTAALVAAAAAVGEQGSLVVSWIDERTGKVVTTAWNDIPQDVRDGIVGGAKVVTFMIPAGAAAKIAKAVPEVKVSNTAIPDGWRPISGVDAQINTPRGFTSYRTPDGDIVHVSPAGLAYKPGSMHGHRVDHVLDHTVPNPSKPTHTVFNAQGDDALALVDEAWSRRTTPVSGNPAAYDVPMGRIVGTSGETTIRVVVKPGTNEIITAYPK